MSIKDNFSQAVKELWKKDGQDEQPAAPAQPSELDGYLRQSAAAPVPPVPPAAQPAPAPVQQPAQQAAPVPPVQPPLQDTNVTGVPLETPYYRTEAPQAQPAPAAGAAQTAARPQSTFTPPPYAPQGIRTAERRRQRSASALRPDRRGYRYIQEHDNRRKCALPCKYANRRQH